MKEISELQLCREKHQNKICESRKFQEVALTKIEDSEENHKFLNQ